MSHPRYSEPEGGTAIILKLLKVVGWPSRALAYTMSQRFRVLVLARRLLFARPPQARVSWATQSAFPDKSVIISYATDIGRL